VLQFSSSIGTKVHFQTGDVTSITVVDLVLFTNALQLKWRSGYWAGVLVVNGRYDIRRLDQPTFVPVELIELIRTRLIGTDRSYATD